MAQEILFNWRDPLVSSDFDNKTYSEMGNRVISGFDPVIDTANTFHIAPGSALVNGAMIYETATPLLVDVTAELPGASRVKYAIVLLKYIHPHTPAATATWHTIYSDAGGDLYNTGFIPWSTIRAKVLSELGATIAENQYLIVSMVKFTPAGISNDWDYKWRRYPQRAIPGIGYPEIDFDGSVTRTSGANSHDGDLSTFERAGMKQMATGRDIARHLPSNMLPNGDFAVWEDAPNDNTTPTNYLELPVGWDIETNGTPLTVTEIKREYTPPFTLAGESLMLHGRLAGYYLTTDLAWNHKIFSCLSIQGGANIVLGLWVRTVGTGLSLEFYKLNKSYGTGDSVSYPIPDTGGQWQLLEFPIAIQEMAFEQAIPKVRLNMDNNTGGTTAYIDSLWAVFTDLPSTEGYVAPLLPSSNPSLTNGVVGNLNAQSRAAGKLVQSLIFEAVGTWGTGSSHDFDLSGTSPGLSRLAGTYLYPFGSSTNLFFVCNYETAAEPGVYYNALGNMNVIDFNVLNFAVGCKLTWNPLVDDATNRNIHVSVYSLLGDIVTKIRVMVYASCG